MDTDFYFQLKYTIFWINSIYCMFGLIYLRLKKEEIFDWPHYFVLYNISFCRLFLFKSHSNHVKLIVEKIIKLCQQYIDHICLEKYEWITSLEQFFKQTLHQKSTNGCEAPIHIPHRTIPHNLLEWGLDKIAIWGQLEVEQILFMDWTTFPPFLRFLRKEKQLVYFLEINLLWSKAAIWRGKN